MILDLAKYRLAKPGLIRSFTIIQEKDVIRKLGLVATSTHVPLIAVGNFILEEFGPNAEIEASLVKLMHFYKIEKVIG